MSETALTQADRLRPLTFDDYIGQEKMKARLKVHLAAAAKRGQFLGHTLLLGPPGSGKTTMAAILANMMECELHTFECPLNDADHRQMRSASGELFFDEIHAASKREQEEFLPLLEHNYFRPKGKFKMQFGPNTTFVGATTMPSKVIKPLVDRFAIKPYFDPYTDDEMRRITEGMAKRIGVNLSSDDCLLLGKAAAGVPRKASHLVTAAQDIVDDSGKDTTAAAVLAFTRTTLDGLTPDHVTYIDVMMRMDACVGLNSLKQMLELDEGSILDIERLLMRQGFLERSAKGRELTTTGYRRGKELENTSL